MNKRPSAKLARPLPMQMRRLLPASAVLVGGMLLIPGPDATAADFSTPSAALKSLEAAYAVKSIDAAIAARDFDAEAHEMLHAIELENPVFKVDPQMLKEMSAKLEAGYREEIASKGFPDMSQRKCDLSEEPARQSGLVPIREICTAPDGSKSDEVYFAVKTDAGWKIVNHPNTGDQ
jgi:hypothetical protein